MMILQKMSPSDDRPIVSLITAKTVAFRLGGGVRFLTKTKDQTVTMWGIHEAQKIESLVQMYEGLETADNPIEDTFNINKEFKSSVIYKAYNLLKKG